MCLRVFEMMRYMRMEVRLGAFFPLMLTLYSSVAFSYDCGGEDKDTSSDFERAVYVFVGMVMDIRLSGDFQRYASGAIHSNESFIVEEKRKAELRERAVGPVSASFAVFEALKGNVTEMPRIEFSGYAGDVYPVVGATFLIFSDAAGNTGSCAGSIKLAESNAWGTAELQILRKVARSAGMKSNP